MIDCFVNTSLIDFGKVLIPPPEDTSPLNAVVETTKLFTPIDFVFPFTAHAPGPVFGAWLATVIATKHQTRFAIGGILTAGMRLDDVAKNQMS